MVVSVSTPVPSWSRSCWARARPAWVVPPSTRAARAPSWAAARAMWAAWYHRANWTMAVISISRSGMTNTVCNVADPGSFLPAKTRPMTITLLRLLAAGGDAVGLVGHLDGDDGDHGDGQGGQP